MNFFSQFSHSHKKHQGNRDNKDISSSIVTTAVEDIDRNAPTNTPSEGLPPHNCKMHAT